MLKQDQKNNAIAEIRQLLNMSLACLNEGELDRMAWRLADAGGLLREVLGAQDAGQSLIGRDEPTGRDYLLPGKCFRPAKPVIQVEVRNVYGQQKIYPINERAKLLAKVAKQITLNPADLEYAKQMGYEIEEVAIPKIGRAA